MSREYEMTEAESLKFEQGYSAGAGAAVRLLEIEAARFTDERARLLQGAAMEIKRLLVTLP